MISRMEENGWAPRTRSQIFHQSDQADLVKSGKTEIIWTTPWGIVQNQILLPDFFSRGKSFLWFVFVNSFSTVLLSVDSHMTDNKKKKTVVAVSAACTAVISHYIQQRRNVANVVALVAQMEDKSSSKYNNPQRKPQGRYTRNTLDVQSSCTWNSIQLFGNELKFLHFTSLNRKAFGELTKSLRDYILSKPLDPRTLCATAVIRKIDLEQRIHSVSDIVAMTLKFLLSKTEYKDLHIQFGATLTTYKNCVRLGMEAIVTELINHPKARVYWDRSQEGMERAAARTQDFLDIPNVIGMIDGDKIRGKEPMDIDEQNRDYNGWTKDVNRNLVLVWDPFGKVVDCGVNAPGCFHHSKITRWCNVYAHIVALPAPFKICCDDAFYTRGMLKDKIVKTKEEYSEDLVRSFYDQSLTHLRQCSEWGNNVLTGCFRRLRTDIPTNNVKRATLFWACILMHNFRTETVGQNQILTYFNMLEEEKATTTSDSSEVEVEDK